MKKPQKAWYDSDGKIRFNCDCGWHFFVPTDSLPKEVQCPKCAAMYSVDDGEDYPCIKYLIPAGSGQDILNMGVDAKGADE